MRLSFATRPVLNCQSLFPRQGKRGSAQRADYIDQVGDSAAAEAGHSGDKDRPQDKDQVGDKASAEADDKDRPHMPRARAFPLRQGPFSTAGRYFRARASMAAHGEQTLWTKTRWATTLLRKPGILATRIARTCCARAFSFAAARPVLSCQPHVGVGAGVVACHCQSAFACQGQLWQHAAPAKYKDSGGVQGEADAAAPAGDKEAPRAPRLHALVFAVRAGCVCNPSCVRLGGSGSVQWHGILNGQGWGVSCGAP